MRGTTEKHRLGWSRWAVVIHGSGTRVAVNLSGIDFTGFQLDKRSTRQSRSVGRIKRRVTTVRTRGTTVPGPRRGPFLPSSCYSARPKRFFAASFGIRGPSNGAARREQLAPTSGPRRVGNGRKETRAGETRSHYSLLFTRNSVELATGRSCFS